MLTECVKGCTFYRNIQDALQGCKGCVKGCVTGMQGVCYRGVLQGCKGCVKGVCYRDARGVLKGYVTGMQGVC